MLEQKAIKEGNFQAGSVSPILQLGNKIIDCKFVSVQPTEMGLLRGYGEMNLGEQAGGITWAMLLKGYPRQPTRLCVFVLGY